jgi:hypothetical protein
MDISQINRNLFVSARVKDEDVGAVLRLDPGLTISMILERRPPPSLEEHGLQVLWLRTVDVPLIPIPLRVLRRGVEAALPVIREGGRILAFCQGGRHRSVAMACCILIATGLPAEEAMGLVDGRREAADPWAWHIQRQIRRFAAAWRRG